MTAGLMQQIREMRADHNKTWDSAELQSRFEEIVGTPIKELIN